MGSELTFWLTVIGFTLTYVGLAVGKIPRLRTDRTGIAVVGAAFLLGVGALTADEAARAIDHETLVLLFSMMVVVGYLRLAGFFEALAGWASTRIRRPHLLLAATVAAGGALSAFLVNDVVCVALTPLLLHLARRLRLDPVPHLIGLATAANIGSTATITGNPQNMIIASLSHITYLHFAIALAPVAVLGLVLDYLVIAVVYRRALAAKRQEEAEEVEEVPTEKPVHRKLLTKGLVVTGGTVVLFFVGLPVALVALVAAAVLLLDRVRPVKVYRQVDWGLLVMFTGLFVVVHAFEVKVVRPWGLEHWGPLQRDPVGVLSLLSAALSNLVSNVPAVLLFKPVIPAMAAGDQPIAWLALAMSSTLAGNLTVLGSVANLIVVENARREGVSITFVEYLRVGVPVTLLTLALGVGWMYLLR